MLARTFGELPPVIAGLHGPVGVASWPVQSCCPACIAGANLISDQSTLIIVVESIVVLVKIRFDLSHLSRASLRLNPTMCRFIKR
jgi:hypothetical protein